MAMFFLECVRSASSTRGKSVAYHGSTDWGALPPPPWWVPVHNGRNAMTPFFSDQIEGAHALQKPSILNILILELTFCQSSIKWHVCNQGIAI